MDTELLVDGWIEEGRQLVAELIREGFDVAVAVWAKTAEEGIWRLYIGSDSVDVESIGDAYRTVYACLSRIPNPTLSLSEIKLVPPIDPIARDAIAIRDRYGARIPTRYRGDRLGELPIEEAYIYPLPAGPMTTSDVMQTVVSLMNRTGPLQPSVVTLRDGSAVRAIPRGIQMHEPGDVQIVFHDLATNSDRLVPAGDVVNIQ